MLVGETDRRPRSSQVPDEIEGEHADEHMGTHARFAPVVDGTQVSKSTVFRLRKPCSLNLRSLQASTFWKVPKAVLWAAEARIT